MGGLGTVLNSAVSYVIESAHVSSVSEDVSLSAYHRFRIRTLDTQKSTNDGPPTSPPTSNIII